MFGKEKLKNARRKLLNLRNKHSVFVPNVAIVILKRNLIKADFDHMLGNHF